MKKVVMGAGCGALGVYSLRRYWAEKTRNTYARDMSDQIVVITGGSSGIGRGTMRELVKRNARVYITGRDEKKGSDAIGIILNEQQDLGRAMPRLSFHKLDFGDLESVRRFSDEMKRENSRIDILINNAGGLTPEYRVTKDGVEEILATNHFGPVYLTDQLMPLLKKSKEARIINLTSMWHKYGLPGVPENKFHEKLKEVFQFNGKQNPFNSWDLYGDAKLGQVLFTKALAQKLEETDPTIKTVSVHPGIVKTELFSRLQPRHQKFFGFIIPILGYFFKTEDEGAQTTLAAAMMPFSELKNGAYYSDCKEDEPHKLADDPKAVSICWETTMDRLASLRGKRPFS